MIKKEFIQYIQELENFYGQSLNDTEREIWYENLKFMTVERFNYILAELYKINKFMPRLSEVLDMHKQISYTVKTEETTPKKHCEKCNDTGYVLFKKIINGQVYTNAAVCDCGRQQRYEGRQCADIRNKSDYYIPTAKEIGLKIETHMPSNEEVIKSMKMLKDSPIVSEDIKNIIRENLKKRRVTNE